MLYRYLIHQDPNLNLYIEGLHLLFLLQRLVDHAQVDAARSAEGDGTLQNPWRFRDAAQWMGCASKLKGGADQYLVVAGRLLKKDNNRYISDQGPAWRSQPGAADAVSPQFWALQSTAPGAVSNASKAFDGEAPKYRQVAENIVDPGRNLPDSTEERKAAGLPPVSSWAVVNQQPAMVRAMRAFLRNDSALSASTNSENIATYNASYSRMQTMLPVLTAAMFLAEPSRNMRAFPINLMLLDLAERGVYTLDRIVWHPYDLRIPERQYSDGNVEAEKIQGPLGVNRGLTDVRRINDMHLVGGAMPASPTKGGDLGRMKPNIPKNRPKNIPQFTKFDYIHQKEISVVARWCEAIEPGTWHASGTLPEGATPIEWIDVVYQPRTRAPLHEKLQGLQTQINSRTRSLDSM